MDSDRNRDSLLEKTVLPSVEASQGAGNREPLERMLRAFTGLSQITCLLVEGTPWSFILSMFSFM